jgi:choline dehydrogenase-like flavoprotein
MSAPSRVHGERQRTHLQEAYDVVVVGSGPGGSAVARQLAAAGARVAVVEAGPWAVPRDFAEGSFSAMARHYRQLGASLAWGPAPIPVVQGRMVGGTTPINGAICWRLPQDVHAAWLARDPALEAALPWAELEAITDALEQRLNVHPTPPELAGPKSLLMAQGAEALGLEHRPIRRNVAGCAGLARCMQGCPRGAKLSVDRTILADAEADGAVVYSNTRALRIAVEGGRAQGVVARTTAGARVYLSAASAVVLAAGALHSPALLHRSGLRHPHTGRHFQAHPGVSVAGHFAAPVRMWEGATQGHEVTGLRHEGLKFESLSYGFGVMAGRVPGVGRRLREGLEQLAHEAVWGAAVKAEAEGRVWTVGGRPVLTYRLTTTDLARVRRGVRVLGELFLAAGATTVQPGVRGGPTETRSVEALRRLETAGPRSAAAFTAVMTHLFGTCRMGSDPQTSVVGPDFAHHGLDGLYVSDASVFPTNTGVNPQISILALATLCGRRLQESL